MRIMPKQGYYVYMNQLTGTFVDVFYTTGVRGGGGHKWYRFDNGQCGTRDPKTGSDWAVLLWTCVPGKERMKDYTYYSNLPPGIPSF